MFTVWLCTVLCVQRKALEMKTKNKKCILATVCQKILLYEMEWKL